MEENLISVHLKNEIKTNYDLIVSKLQDIKSFQEIEYVTSGQFRYNPSNTYSGVDIHTSQSISELIHVWAFIENKSKDYYNAANQLGVDHFPIFKWMSYTPEDWRSDISTRIQILQCVSDKDKLLKWKAKFEDLLSEDDKVTTVLNEFKDDLPF